MAYKQKPFDSNYSKRIILEDQEHHNNLQELATKQKHPKYYSNNDYSGTVKKSLFENFNNLQQHDGSSLPKKSQENGFSTFLSLKSTIQTDQGNQLLQQYHQNLQAYENVFNKNVKGQKLRFTQLEFEDNKAECSFKNQPHESINVNGSERERQNKRIKQEFMEAKIANSQDSNRFGQRIKVNHFDREISALYKENRNINFEYRKNKFLQIFSNGKIKYITNDD